MREFKEIIVKKVLIVGGGVAGLSAGIFAQKNGLESHIYEKHTVAGGNLTGWNRKGYHLDNCVHWLTGTNPKNGYYPLWEEIGAIDDKSIYQPSLFFASELNGEQIVMSADVEETRRRMHEISPADAKETDKFIRAVKSFMKRDNILAEKDRVKGEKLSMLALLSYLKVSLQDLADRFKHPLLKKLFTDYIMGEYSSLALIAAYAAFAGGNGALPVGGSKAMADKIAARYTDMGGDLRLGTGVSAVIRSKRRIIGIVLEDGSRIFGDYVIFACDPSVTFSMIEEKMPKGVAKNIGGKKMPVYSSMHCAYAVDSAKMPFEGNLIIQTESNDPLIPDRLILREYSHESGFAPEGKNVLQVLIYIKDEQSEEWMRLRSEDRAAYRARKNELAAELERCIAARFPELDGKMSLLDFWTPATYKRYFDGHGGTWMGVLLPGRLPLVKETRISGLKNAFLATQWVRAPGGLPNALTGGELAVKSMLKQIKRDGEKIELSETVTTVPHPARQR